MARLLHLRVLTPAATLLEAANAEWVHVRLADGTGLTIYPRHAPLLGETVTAPLRYADEAGEHTLDVEAGILHVEDDGVMIFTSGKAEAGELGRPSAISAEKRFDRLARELRARLEAEPESLLEADRERRA